MMDLKHYEFCSILVEVQGCLQNHSYKIFHSISNVNEHYSSKDIHGHQGCYSLYEHFYPYIATISSLLAEISLAPAAKNGSATGQQLQQSQQKQPLFTYCIRNQESITVGGVYSRETSNDICAWAACTVLLIASRLVTKASHTKWRRMPKEDES